jgi:hypothetical protein
LNCVRILTRILPFIYEADHLDEWEEKFFWGWRKKRTRQAQVATEVLFDEGRNEGEEETHTQTNENDRELVKPLAEELVDTLLDLLFYTNFTIPKLATTKAKVTYAIWQSGVGCNSPLVSSKEHESNRAEVLRLLLTLTGKSMYMPPSELSAFDVTDSYVLIKSGLLPVKGVKAITYIATCSDKQIVLSTLCSLLNTVGCVLCHDSSFFANTESRPSNTTQQYGEFLMIMSFGKIPNRILLYIVCSFSL